jgi:hypothetical protein
VDEENPLAAAEQPSGALQARADLAQAPRGQSGGLTDQSRLITEAETAQLLGMSASAFSRRASEFEDELGMPRRHPMLKRRDRVAINNWLDQVFSVDRKSTTVSELVRKRMAELCNG